MGSLSPSAEYPTRSTDTPIYLPTYGPEPYPSNCPATLTFAFQRVHWSISSSVTKLCIALHRLEGQGGECMHVHVIPQFLICITKRVEHRVYHRWLIVCAAELICIV